MPLSAEDVQAAGLQDPLPVSLDLLLDRREDLVPLLFPLVGLGLDAELDELEVGLMLSVAAELDVDTTAGHVGRDRDRARTPGLGDDLSLALGVLGLCVEHGVLDPRVAETVAEDLGDLHGDRADQYRLRRLLALLDLIHDGGPLAVLGLVDRVV